MLDLLNKIDRRTNYLDKYLPRTTNPQVVSLTEAGKLERGAIAPRQWAKRNRRIDDQPFTLKRFPPLFAMYNDDHPCIVVIKPAQRGVSEWAVTRAIHAIDVGSKYWNLPKTGLNVGYLFPTKEALGDFSKERISDLKNESEYLGKLFESGYDAVTFKQIGASYLYLRGAWSKAALKSFPADLLIFDEYDEMAPQAVSLARKRLNASLLGHEIYISTPTLPGRGIHAEYLRSDQRVWETQCKDCGEFNELDFFRDVRANGEIYTVWRDWTVQKVQDAQMTVHCPNCKAEIDRCGPGRWRAKEPQNTVVRGYHIPWWPFPFVSLNKLAKNAISTDPTDVQEFYRSDLGLPYEPQGSRVTEAMLLALANDLPNGRLPETLWTRTTMGVDVGAVFNYRNSSTGSDGHRYVRAIGAAKTWNDLSKLMQQYAVRLCVIDAMPELHGCKTFAAKHPGKVVRALYPNSAAMAGQLFRLPSDAQDKPKRMLVKKKKPKDADNSDTVQINRTMAMDAVYDAIAEAKERWPLAVINTPDVIAQMIAPVRVLTKDARGQEVAAWEHTMPDHYFHACVYEMIAQRLLPKAIGGFLGQGSAKGWSPK